MWLSRAAEACKQVMVTREPIYTNLVGAILAWCVASSVLFFLLLCRIYFSFTIKCFCFTSLHIYIYIYIIMYVCVVVLNE